MTEGLLLLSGLAALLSSAVAGFRWARAWLALAVGGAIIGMVTALWTLLGGGWEWQSAFMLDGQPLHFRLDSVGAWFLMLVAVVGGAGAIYSREYWSDHHYPDSAPKGRVWWSLFLICMGLVLTVSNGLHFLIAWELFAVCGYFLITLDRQRREARAAGWLYLAASYAGTMCPFAFFALLASALLWRRTCRKDLRHGPTWDCGYVLRTARMQYGGARRLQHGRLQFYILYVLAGVAGLGALVVIGGAQ